MAKGFALMGLQFSQLRGEMRAGFSAVRTEIREGDEETRRVRTHVLVLHEDVVSRFAVLDEHANGRRPSRVPRKAVRKKH